MDTKKLRQKILDLAIRGKLVPQDPNDEPASVLLDRIRAEKERLIAEGKIKRSKKSKTSDASHYQNFEPPFEIPDSWEWTPLNCMCTIFGRIGFRGYTKDDLVDFTGAITLSPSNIVDGVMNYEKCTYISWEKYDESPEIQVHNHDILLVKTGSSFGKCAYVESLPKEATINPQFVVLKNIGCNHKFLTYCLQSNYARTKYEEFVLGTAIPTFTQVALGAMLIPMPPLNEQERIVADIEKLLILVDLLDESKQDVEIMISTLRSKILGLAISGKLVPQNPNDEPAIDALRRINSSFQPCDNPQYEHMPFKIPESWSWCLFSDIAQSNIGLTYKPTDIVSTGGTPVYRSNNIQNKCIDTSDIVRVNTEIRENQFLNVGDLLICARNGSRNLVGKCALINELDEPTSFGAFMAVSRSLYNTWIFQVLNSDYFDRYLDESNSTAINQVTQKMLLALQIPFPPIAEQQRIVDKVNELFTILDSIQNSLDAN
jgi:type I restriction enzyme S subunit